MIPRRNTDSPICRLLNPDSKDTARRFIPAGQLAHVAARYAERGGEIGLPDLGGFEECFDVRHSPKVGTLRTYMQAKVSTERLACGGKFWHHANMGLRIRTLRKERGLTGEHLADMVGVSKGYISELETGKKTPGAALVMRLAVALKCEVYQLYEGSDEEQKDAAMRAHMQIMSQLPDEDRNAIQKAALGLAAKLT